MSNHGLPPYSVSDLLKEVIYPHTVKRGAAPSRIVLEWDKYIPMLDDLFSDRRWQVKPYTLVPNLTVAEIPGPGGLLKVISRHGAELLTQERLLEVWASAVMPNHASAIHGQAILQLGNYRYPIASHLSTSIILRDEQSPCINKDTKTVEPACLCSGRALATTGHETGCAYIKWKAGK